MPGSSARPTGRQVRAAADEVVALARSEGQAQSPELVRAQTQALFLTFYDRPVSFSKECNDFNEYARIRDAVKRAWRGAGTPGSGATGGGRPKRKEPTE